MRDLARHMVQHMRLRNTIRRMGTEPGHHRAEITKQFTVERRESTTGERVLWCTVVRKERVGVLEEGDQNKPVVDPKNNKQATLTPPETAYQR